jgi:hypothetical protein
MGLDVDTFLTSLYVAVDEWCKERPSERRCGRDRHARWRDDFGANVCCRLNRRLARPLLAFADILVW